MSKREGYQKSGRVWSFAIHEGPKSLEKDGEYQRRLLRKKSGKILVFYQTPSAPPKRSYMVVCTWAANFPSQYVKINFVGAYWESSIKWILDKALTVWCIAMYWIPNELFLHSLMMALDPSPHVVKAASSTNWEGEIAKLKWSWEGFHVFSRGGILCSDISNSPQTSWLPIDIVANGFKSNEPKASLDKLNQSWWVWFQFKPSESRRERE